MKRRKIIPYNPKLKVFARKLRNESTFTEIMVWNYLKKKQLRGYDFDRQKPIDKYIVDFYCKPLKLVIEIDGEIHQFQKEYDQGREVELEKYGLKIIHFTNEEIINNIEFVIEKIKLNIQPATAYKP